MNVSESGLAELYRNLGREVPEGLTVDSLAAAPRKEKYGRVKKEVDGIVFDSTLEAEAYKILKLWELSGEIAELTLQPVFILQDKQGGMRAIKYVADFRFIDPNLREPNQFVVDVKGIQTQAFVIKKKMFRVKFPDLQLQIWDKEKVKEASRF